MAYALERRIHPNTITYGRMIVAPIQALLTIWSPFWAFGLLVALAISDFFDGFIAKRTDRCTPWGGFIDPLADKILVYSNLIVVLPLLWGGYWYFERAVITITVVLLFRLDVLSTIDYHRQLKISTPRHSNNLGKAKTIFCFAAVIMALAVQDNAGNTMVVVIGLVAGWFCATMSMQMKKHPDHTGWRIFYKR